MSHSIQWLYRLRSLCLLFVIKWFLILFLWRWFFVRRIRKLYLGLLAKYWLVSSFNIYDSFVVLRRLTDYWILNVLKIGLVSCWYFISRDFCVFIVLLLMNMVSILKILVILMIYPILMMNSHIYRFLIFLQSFNIISIHNLLSYQDKKTNLCIKK